MNNIMRLKTIACSLLFITNMSFAADWYQVEVVIFEHPLDEALESELWASHPGEPDWDQGITLMDSRASQQIREQRKADINAQKQAYEAELAAYEAAKKAIEQQAQNQSQETEVYYDRYHNEIEVPVTQQPLPELPPEPVMPTIVEEGSTELPFTELNPSYYTLTGVLNKLNAQGGYRVVAHTAWRQPALTNKEVEAVRILGGNIIGQDSMNGPTYEFEGLVTFKKSRYLHVEADMVLREKASSGSSGSYESPKDLGLLDYDRGSRYRVPTFNSYRLKQSQRIRANKLYYYDHPLIGMIVKVSPYEPK